jgi:hypothetical protein
MSQRPFLQGKLSKLSILRGENHNIILRLPNVQIEIQSATSTLRVMLAGVAQGGLVSLFSFCVNDICTPSHHIELVQYADDTIFVTTSCSPSLLVGYWRPIWSLACGTGGLPSTCRGAQLGPLLRPRGACKNTDQCSL